MDLIKDSIMMEPEDDKSFFVENQMEVSVKKGAVPKVTFKFNINPKIIECNRNEVDFIVNSILQEQNMTLEDFKNELDSKLEKVLTMKYYLTKLYKGGNGNGSVNANRDSNVDNSSTSSGGTTASAQTNDNSIPSSTVCGLVTTENPDSTFSWKCCCCQFASTGKNLKSTRESYRKHHKNWHSPDSQLQNNQAGGNDPLGPPPKKRKPSLGSAPRKSKILNSINNNDNDIPSIDDLIESSPTPLNYMNLTDADAAILVDGHVNEDDFSSLFDD